MGKRHEEWRKEGKVSADIKLLEYQFALSAFLIISSVIMYTNNCLLFSSKHTIGRLGSCSSL